MWLMAEGVRIGGIYMNRLEFLLLRLLWTRLRPLSSPPREIVLVEVPLVIADFRCRARIGNGGVRNPLSSVVFIQEIANSNEIVEFGSIMYNLFENCVDDRWRPGVLSGPYPPPL